MIKVSVVGDCHSARMFAHHIMANARKNFVRPTVWLNDRTIDKTEISLSFWGMSGYKCWDLEYQKHYDDKTSSSPAEDIPHLSPLTDGILHMYSFSEVKDSDIVMPWLGYIDCRNYLPKYKNAEEVAKKYFYETLSFFNESQIRFIEPFPQFEMLGTENYHENYTHSERTEQGEIFIKTLHDLSMENGLLPPISQSIVYDALETDKLIKKFAKQGGEYHNYTLLDALRSEDNRKVYDKLIPEIISTVELLS